MSCAGVLAPIVLQHYQTCRICILDTIQCLCDEHDDDIYFIEWPANGFNHGVWFCSINARACAACSVKA
jgi:hypothetical protein